MDEKVYIKHLPKDKLLYELWKSAKPARQFYYCKDLIPEVDKSTITDDINHMIANNRRIDLTTYHGKQLFIDITDDFVDCFDYDLYNGHGVAEKIIIDLKKEELAVSICTYVKFK
jgi:hypothetical protein